MGEFGSAEIIFSVTVPELGARRMKLIAEKGASICCIDCITSNCESAGGIKISDADKPYAVEV